MSSPSSVKVRVATAMSQPPTVPQGPAPALSAVRLGTPMSLLLALAYTYGLRGEGCNLCYSCRCLSAGRVEEPFFFPLSPFVIPAPSLLLSELPGIWIKLLTGLWMCHKCKVIFLMDRN